jgi:hypothetical protein
MTDQELVEKAAKVAGVHGQWASVHQAYGDTKVEGIYIGTLIFWNPLTDDGDALRLAVKLDMIDERQWKAPITGAIYEECGGDWYAATRRAIVLAAAAIAG